MIWALYKTDDEPSSMHVMFWIYVCYEIQMDTLENSAFYFSRLIWGIRTEINIINK